MRIALRVHWPQIVNEERLAELMAFLARNREGLEEIVFFTENVHGYLPVSDFKERIPTLSTAVDAVRVAGLRTGINILNTIGQFDECPSMLPEMDVPPFAGLDGEVALSCSCPASREFLQATTERYRLAAELEPNVIWIDDDLRLIHHGPVQFGCFCQGCLDDFSERVGHRFTGEQLKEALKEDKWPEKNLVRAAWLQRNSDVVNQACATIESAVHGMSSSTELGLMGSWQTYGGAGLGRWLTALRGPDRVPVHYRPGGGFYSEDWLSKMIEKAVSLPPDVSDQPVEIATVQCEMESFPYCPLDKTPHTTMVENTCHHAAGCNGLLLNVISDAYGPLEEYSQIFEQMRKWLPFWEKSSENIGDMPLAGLWEAVSPYGEATSFTKNAWPAGYRGREITWRLAQFGLPISVSFESARGAVLAGSGVTTLPLDKIEDILKRGAIIDGDALGFLWQAELGELTGVKVDKAWKPGVMEQHADHPWNAGFEGSYRDARAGFFHRTDDTYDYTLTPLDDSVVPLSYMVSQDEETTYGICACTYENKYGGRIVTLGYRPWEFFRRQLKHQQYARAARWVSHDTLPLWVETFCNVTPFVRQMEPGGKFAALLLNATIQPQVDVKIGLAADYDQLSLIRPFEDGVEHVLKPVQAERGWQIAIPKMGAWEWVLVYST